MKSKQNNPEDWFVELDQINEQLGEIDGVFKKSEKEMCSHIISNLPKGYSGVKNMIQLVNKYLDDCDAVKKIITKHWKVNHRKKKSKYVDSDSDSSSTSENSESSESRKKNKKKDKYALAITKEGEDRVNENGKLMCGYCRRIGHEVKNCWEKNGKPSNYNGNTNNNVKKENGGRKC